MKLTLNPPYFIELTKKWGGQLIDTPACHACWYYYVLATRAKELAGDSIDDQIIYEGEPWRKKHYAQQKKSIALLYGVEPQELDGYWSNVAAQAKVLGLPEPALEILLKQRIIIN